MWCIQRASHHREFDSIDWFRTVSLVDQYEGELLTFFPFSRIHFLYLNFYESFYSALAYNFNISNSISSNNVKENILNLDYSVETLNWTPLAGFPLVHGLWHYHHWHLISPKLFFLYFIIPEQFNSYHFIFLNEIK